MKIRHIAGLIAASLACTPVFSYISATTVSSPLTPINEMVDKVATLTSRVELQVYTDYQTNSACPDSDTYEQLTSNNPWVSEITNGEDCDVYVTFRTTTQLPLWLQGKTIRRVPTFQCDEPKFSNMVCYTDIQNNGAIFRSNVDIGKESHLLRGTDYNPCLRLAETSILTEVPTATC